MMQDAKERGIVMSEQDARAADAFHDQLTRLQAVSRGFVLQIGNELIPALTDFTEAMTTAAGSKGGGFLRLVLEGIRETATMAGAAMTDLVALTNVLLSK